MTRSAAASTAAGAATRLVLVMSAPHFRSTRWSLVARASSTDRGAAQVALGELCSTYWFPLYAFARRRGISDADSLDLVQSFCAELLERGGLAGADRDRGRFRHYLLGAFRHFADNQARAARREKRGGQAMQWSFDDAAERYTGDHDLGADPEHLFERRWALALLERATTRLRDEYATPVKRSLFAALSPALLGEADPPTAASVAAILGCSEGAVRVALHRLRSRMRELIRDEVLQTVADPADVDAELAALRATLSLGAGKSAPDQ